MNPDQIRSAMDGGSESWSAIYAAMFDSWPRLMKSVDEIRAEVIKSKWRVKPLS